MVTHEEYREAPLKVRVILKILVYVNLKKDNGHGQCEGYEVHLPRTKQRLEKESRSGVSVNPGLMALQMNGYPQQSDSTPSSIDGRTRQK